MGYRCPTCTLENTAFSGWGTLYLCRSCGAAFCDRCNEGDEAENQCPACHAVANPKRGEAMSLTPGETKVASNLQVKLWKIMRGSEPPIEAYAGALRATAFPNHPAEAIYKSIENAAAAKSPKDRKELLTEGGRFHSWNKPEIGPGDDRGFRFGVQFLDTNMPLAGWKYFVAGMEHGSDRAFWAYFDQGTPFFQEKYHADIKTHLAKRLEKTQFDATPGDLVRAAAAVFGFAPDLATATLSKLKSGDGGAAPTSQAEMFPAAVAKALLKLQPWLEQTQQLDLARAVVTYCQEHTAWDQAQHVAILPWVVMLRAECYAPLRNEWLPRLLSQVIVGLARDPLPPDVLMKITADFPELSGLSKADRARMLGEALRKNLETGLAVPGPTDRGATNAMYALVSQFRVMELDPAVLGDLPVRLVDAIHGKRPLDAVLPLAVKLHAANPALSLRCLEKWTAGEGVLTKPDRWLAPLGELSKIACSHPEWEAPFLAFLEALYARGWPARMSCSVPAAEYLNGLKSLPPVVIRKRAGEAIFAAVLKGFQAIDARQQGPFTKALPELAEPAKYNLETTAEREARLKREEEERKRREEEERRRLAEEERKRKEAEERARLAAEAKAREEAAEKARRAELERIRQEAEARAKAIAEEEAQKAAAARALLEEEARAKAAEEAKRLAEEVRQKAEALARIRAESEARQRAEAEAKARIAAEAEAFARAQAEARAKAEAEARAAAEARAKAEAEARAKAEAEARARAEAEAKAKAEAEARARAEEERKRQEAEARAQAEAEARARAAEAARLAAEKAAREKAEADAREMAEAEAAVRAAADEAARKEAEDRRRAAEESRQKAEAEAKAAAEAAAAAAEQARLEAAELKRKTDEERLKREAGEKARLEAEALARA
ncbi:MAG TPA: FYVE zinc finger domain-containing protein, partial [Planctomycetota bacterium]|nr:FYVE zinc finger domain-containing protein [Planctomycetota bacterium]